MNNLLKSAIWYQRQGFSVIPVQANKKPYIRWSKHQTQAADETQVREWWSKRPDANIGLVTGAISGIDVVDCDSQAGRDALEEFLPENLITPIVKTPKGFHFYFKHRPGLSNGVRVLRDCDLRTDGGYVIAPPSIGEKGAYSALEGLKISEVEPAAMPAMLFDILQQGGDCNASSREHINGRIPSSGVYKGAEKSSQQPSTSVNKVNISFSKGGRDNALFHLANHLVKGGMPQVNIEKCLHFFGSHCSPPFPEKEIKAKIQSALNRVENSSKNLTATIREFIESTSGNISSTEIQQASTKSTFPSERRKISAILSRMVKEGFIERVGNQNGLFRRVENQCEAEDWLNADLGHVDLRLPFGLHKMIDIPPGSIILIAGAQDAGKSAFLMNMAKENRHNWKVHYFSSELNAAAFKMRVSKFPDIMPNQFNVKFYQRSENFHDVIKTGPKDLNLIDYLEVHTEFYRVSEYLAKIHRKIGNGIATIAIQKDPNALNGRGGSFTQEKPVLSLALDYGVCTITKFKGQFKGSNPRGQKYNFKLHNGCEFSQVRGWHK